MKTLLLLTAAAAGIASTSGAQVAKAKADSACTTYPDGRVECRAYRREPGDFRLFQRMDSVMANRAALGVQLRATGTRRDTLGVFVEAVTPGGPAENAGIVEGDRIAAINGVDVRSSPADLDDAYTNGLASHRLTREVQKVKPGARVSLRVYSGGRFRDVQVVAGKASDVMRLGNHFQFRVPGPGGMMQFGPGAGAMMFRSPMPMLRSGTMRPRVRIQRGAGARAIAPRRINGAVIGGDGENIIRLRDGEPLMIKVPEWDFDLPEFDESDGPEGFEFNLEGQPVPVETIREIGESAVREGKWALKKLADEGLLA